MWARRTTEALRITARRFSRGGQSSNTLPSTSADLENSSAAQAPMLASPLHPALPLEDLLNDLRLQARKGEGSPAGCGACLELVVYLVKEVLLELHQMQLA